jgi:chemotaxis protein methyltransferase CheR
LATDIDKDILARAEEGVYASSEVAALPASLVQACFDPVQDEPGKHAIRQNIRQLVAVRHLNLHSDWPMKGPFDAIFCRNVVIYFDKPSQVKLFDRFADILVPDGFLYVGHSESLFKVSERFAFMGQSIYRKIA